MSGYMGEEEVIKMNEALAEKLTYTVEELESMPEGIRAELIDGRIFYQATPSRLHQGLLSFIQGTIWSYIRDQGGNCRVYQAPLALYLNRDNETYLEPDLMVVCDESRLDEKGCHGAPDMVAEIVSPSSRSRDYLMKLSLYQKAGVREYWIVDPEQGKIMVYRFDIGNVEIYGFQDTVGLSVLDGLEIDFSKFKE